MSNILLIVEGSVEEQTVFGEIFTKYGFNTIISKEKMNVENVGQFEKFQYQLNNNNVVIIQGPRNRIHDFLKFYNENEMSIERTFFYSYAFFSGIFLIYDVDHNDSEDVEEMSRRFSDESTGMLLLNSPCIEVLADFKRGRKESKYSRLKEYKAEINNHYHGATNQYIGENFNDIMLYFLQKNFLDFNETNVMEHPALIVKFINENNECHNFKEKEKSYVIYRYFSTVVYVAIAFANGLTREIDNYESVKEFFLQQKNFLSNK